MPRSRPDHTRAPELPTRSEATAGATNPAIWKCSLAATAPPMLKQEAADVVTDVVSEPVEDRIWLS